MATRPINNTLATSLTNNEPHIAVHLIKFEKPSLNPNYIGTSAEEATDYTYITDAPYNINFDDGSFSKVQQRQKELDKFLGLGTTTAIPNGQQVYFANKVLSIGSINEGIEAKASNLNLKLDSSALGSFLSDIVITTAETLGQKTLTTPGVDLSEIGFTEGDSITFSSHKNSAYQNIKVRLDRFTSTGIEVTHIEGTWVNATNEVYSLNLVSEEISTLILGNGSVSYTNYINREVSIYKVFIDPETHEVIGGLPDYVGGTYNRNGAIVLFKGIITNASLDENPLKSSAINWTLSSHWGDFIKVQNRLTNDEMHRALNERGLPDYNILHRKEYGTDFGFEHANRSLNLVSNYNVTETRTKLKEKKKWHGLSSDYELIYYDVEVPTDIDLKVNLSSKALPVVYGVQKIDSIPIFFDNLKKNSDQVYVAYALAEGKMGSILDIVIDDKPNLCTDKNDEDSRSSQNASNSVDVLCIGRQDKGDTLAGTNPSIGTAVYASHAHNSTRAWYERGYDVTGITNEPFIEQGTRLMNEGGLGTKGILHEEAFSVQNPIDATFIYHQGTSYQTADNLLLSKAYSNSFKIQNDFYEGNSYSYYTSNHRLLDTAYVVAEYLISEGETNIPSLDFVVRGKAINCHNYDHTYTPESLTASHSTFNRGDLVNVKQNGSSINTNVKILDKYILQNIDGKDEVRFVFSTELAFIPNSYKFSIQKTSGGVEFDLLISDQIAYAGSVPVALTGDINNYATGPTGDMSISFADLSGNVGISPNMRTALTPLTSVTVGDATYTKSKALISPFSATVPPVARFSYDYFAYDGSTNISVVTIPNGSNGTHPLVGITTSQLNKIAVVNAIALSSTSNDSDLVGYNIIVTRYDSNNIPYTQTRKITDSQSHVLGGTTRVYYVDSPWDPDYLPSSGDFYQIKSPADDRVSLNPAMQLLDYMSSPRYGKGLKDTDIDLETFKEAARRCDTRSDITVIVDYVPDSSGVVNTLSFSNYGETFEFSNNDAYWSGELKSIKNVSVAGTVYMQAVFTNCIGKLVRRWNDYTEYKEGELIYGTGGLKSGLKTVLTAGTVINPTTLADTPAVYLNRVGGSSILTIQLEIGSIGTASDGNPLIKTVTEIGDVAGSGYSLYDSDHIKYWKYLGWPDNSQRNVTRHQFNQTINTTSTIFSNINNMLKQFNGVLRYSNGKYQLSVKSAELGQLMNIEDTDIVGSIKVTDKGSKKTYNAVSAEIQDPQSNFENISVSFFNSTYLKQDKGVSKKGSFTTPAITNYYNARVGIKQFLDESRNGLEIQMTVRPVGLLLLAGEVFSLDYPRFGWEAKKWRITNLNFLKNGLVSVTAEEHSDDAYLVTPSDEDGDLQQLRTGSGSATPFISSKPQSPYGLSVSQNLVNSIKLAWQNASNFKPETHFTQIFRNTVDSRNATATGLSLQFAQISKTISLEGDLTGTFVPGMVIENPDVSWEKNVNFLDTDNEYKIKELGDTDWNAAAGTTGLTYEVGDKFILKNSTGTTTGKCTGVQRPVSIVSVTPANPTVIVLDYTIKVDIGATVNVTTPVYASSEEETVFNDSLAGEDGNISYYYWIRHGVRKPQNIIAGLGATVHYSDFFPNTNTGIEGIGTTETIDAIRAVNVEFNNPGHFIYDKEGFEIESTVVTYPTSVTLTATGINGQGTEEYQFLVKDFQGNNVPSQTRAFSANGVHTIDAPEDSTRTSANGAFLKMPYSVEVTYRDTVGGDVFTAIETVQLTASRVITDGAIGNSAIGVEISNNNHTFLIDSGSTTLTGSGTIIKVYEGTQELTFKDHPATPYQSAADIGLGQFYINVTTPSGLTLPTGGLINPTSTDYAEMPDYIGWTGSSGQVVFDIVGNRLDGTDFTSRAVQSLTSSVSGSSLRLNSTSYAIKYDRIGNRIDTSFVLSIATTGLDPSNIWFRITVDKNDGTQVIYNQISNTKTYSVDSSVGKMPLNIKAEAYPGTNTSATVSALDVLASDNITIIPTTDAASINITAPSSHHTFFATSEGVLSTNDFESSITVVINGQVWSYRAVPTPGANHFSIDTPSGFNCNPQLSATGALEIANNSGITENNTDHLEASMNVRIRDSYGDTLGVYPFKFTKALTIETSLSYAFEVADYSYLSNADAGVWVGTLNDAVARSAARAVIADNGKIMPGDKVTLSSNTTSSNPSLVVIGQRVYTGPRRTSHTLVSLNDWSNIVVESFPGSVIVNGTLDASVLTAGTTFTSELNLSNNLILGTSTANGRIYSRGKTSFGGSTNGLYMNGGPSGGSFDITSDNGATFLRFDPTNGLTLQTVGGAFTHKSATTGSRVEILGDRIRIISGNQERVRIGNLTGF